MFAMIMARLGFGGCAAVIMAALLGVQTLRLSMSDGALTKARADVITAKAAAKLSEDRRAVEYSQAVKDLGDAETACSARVAQAVKSGAAIHAIVAKPVRLDPKSGCPLRDLVSAGELRDTFQPRP